MSMMIKLLHAVAFGSSPLLNGDILAAGANRASAGNLRNGTNEQAITPSRSHDVSARNRVYDATVQSPFAPDRNDEPADVFLGDDKLSSYVDYLNFFGLTGVAFEPQKFPDAPNERSFVSSRFAIDTPCAPAINYGLITLA